MNKVTVTEAGSGPILFARDLKQGQIGKLKYSGTYVMRIYSRTKECVITSLEDGITWASESSGPELSHIFPEGTELTVKVNNG